MMITMTTISHVNDDGDDDDDSDSDDDDEGGWVGRWVCRWVGGLVDGCRWMDVCTNDWTDVWVGELGVEDGGWLAGWLTECPLCEIGGLSLCPL